MDTGNKTWINGVQMLGDAIIFNLSIIVTFLIRFQGHLPEENFADYLYVLPWITIIALFMFNFYGLYSTKSKSWTEIFTSLICCLFFITLLSFTVSFLARGFRFPRSVLLLSPFIELVLIGLWRYLVHRLELMLRPVRKVVVIGELEQAQRFADKLKSAGNGGYEIVGFIIKKQVCTQLGKYKVLGKIEDTVEILGSIKPDDVYICSKVDEYLRKIISSICMNYPWRVYLIPNLYEILIGRSKLEHIDDTPVFEIGAPVSASKLKIKRSVDVTLSLLGLIIFSPLILAIAILIKIDSSGPVFYKQARISENNRKIDIIKFRTMVVNAENFSGPMLALANDVRITRIGRFLRKTRMDEIPQLINVIKGEMSIVGPRPERPYFVQKFAKELPEYSYRHGLKAGITGLAQVAGKYTTTAEDKLRYDLLYSKALSPILDLKIMMQTFKVLLLKDKAN